MKLEVDVRNIFPLCNTVLVKIGGPVVGEIFREIQKELVTALYTMTSRPI